MGAVRLRNDELVRQEIEGQVVVLDTRSSTYHAVEGAGTLLWPLLVGGTSRAALVVELRRTFDLAEERAGRDVDEFLRGLAPLLSSG